MTAPTEQQLNDPAWWDENAPEDTTHYCPVAKLFYNDSYPIAPCCIRRPAKPEPADYDRSIHSNPDHTAWAKFFLETFPNCGVDEETMAGWFANAMMARHDFDAKPEAKDWDGEGLPPVGCKCEYSLKGDDGPWFKCEIISHNRLVIRCPHLQDDSDNGLQVVDRKVVFRPMRTQAERDRDELVKTVGLHLAGDPQEIADAIIAAGWRKGE